MSARSRIRARRTIGRLGPRLILQQALEDEVTEFLGRARYERAEKTIYLKLHPDELERTFVELRRRTNVIGRFPGETSGLSLIRAVLEFSSRGWRGVVMTPKTVAEIERLRRQRRHGRPRGGGRRLASPTSGATPAHFHPETGTPPRQRGASDCRPADPA